MPKNLKGYLLWSTSHLAMGWALYQHEMRWAEQEIKRLMGV